MGAAAKSGLLRSTQTENHRNHGNSWALVATHFTRHFQQTDVGSLTHRLSRDYPKFMWCRLKAREASGRSLRTAARNRVGQEPDTSCSTRMATRWLACRIQWRRIPSRPESHRRFSLTAWNRALHSHPTMYRQMASTL